MRVPLWILGWPAAAIADAEQAVRNAREMGFAGAVSHLPGRHVRGVILAGLTAEWPFARRIPPLAQDRPQDSSENSIDVMSLPRQLPWPKNRLRIRPTDRKLVVGPIRAETRQRLSEAVCRPFGGQGSECAHRRPTRMRRTARPFLCELRRAGREPT